MNAPWKRGDQGLAPTRPAPRTEGWYRSQAEHQYAGMAESLVKRAKVRDFITYLKQIDKAVCGSIR